MNKEVLLRKGIIDITNNNLVLPLENEDIYCGSDDYCITINEKDYKVYDLNNKKYVLENKKILTFSDKYILTNDNNNYYLIDYKGNKIINVREFSNNVTLNNSTFYCSTCNESNISFIDTFDITFKENNTCITYSYNYNSKNITSKNITCE